MWQTQKHNTNGWVSIRRMSSTQENLQLLGSYLLSCFNLHPDLHPVLQMKHVPPSSQHSRLSEFMHHGRSEWETGVHYWAKSMTTLSHEIAFFKVIIIMISLFLGSGGCHCSWVWQLAAPSLLSILPLAAVLQSAKLLSESLERHMLTFSSHHLPYRSLSRCRSPAHTHTFADA